MRAQNCYPMLVAGFGKDMAANLKMYAQQCQNRGWSSELSPLITIEHGMGQLQR